MKTFQGFQWNIVFAVMQIVIDGPLTRLYRLYVGKTSFIVR